MPPIRAVLFDLDGTLLDRERAFAAWAIWFVRERLGLRDPTVQAGAVAEILALDAAGRGDKAAMFRHLLTRYPALSGTPDALVTALRRQLVDHLGDLDPDPAAVLDALDAAGLPWGIVTNGSRGQLRKIERLGLAGRTPCVVVSEIAGVRKPDPAIFRIAADLLRVDPASALFVGDHPEADIAGAAAAGMRTAWLRQGRQWPEHAPSPPDLVIDSLTELGPIIAAGSF